MKSPSLAVCLVAGLAAAGCRVDPNIQLLERDLRRQDMKIYELQDKIADYQAELDSCRRENASLRRQLGQGKPEGPGWPDDLMKTPEVTLPGEPGAPPAEPDRPDGLPVPQIETPGTPLPPGEVPDSLRQLQTPKPSSLPGPEPETKGPEMPHGTDAPGLLGIGGPVDATDANTRVAQIELGATLTGGFNADHQPGDEGIEVLIVPRDGEGRVVRAAAPISVVVGDPQLPGPNPYVARWDFSAEETAKLFEKTLFGEGIHLTMLWPVDSPEHRNLRLFVRYTTDDGRNLDADRQITVEPTGRLAGDAMPALRDDSTAQSQPAAEKHQASEIEVAPPQPQLVEPAPQTARNVDAPSTPEQPNRPHPLWSPER